MFTTLISTYDLAVRLADPALVLLDCTFDLAKTEAGERSWRAGHITGAAYASLNRDLSSPPNGSNGRHPLPTVEALAAQLGAWGIDATKQVVAYDQDLGMFAARLWWLLKWLGHDQVAVLDGGFAKWQREGRPTRGGDEPLRAAATFAPALREALRVTVDRVERLITDENWRLVDARAPQRFRGETSPLDAVAGHIPGAQNRFFQSNLNSDGTWRAPDALRTAWQALLDGVPGDRTVCYCGSGVTACHNLLALELAGVRGAKLYPGSWSEWSSDPTRPVATGEA